MTAAARTGGGWRPAPFARLCRYCRSILHNDADAQDALQSMFASAFAALQTGQRDAPMRPWLFRIAGTPGTPYSTCVKGAKQLLAAAAA